MSKCHSWALTHLSRVQQTHHAGNVHNVSATLEQHVRQELLHRPEWSNGVDAECAESQFQAVTSNLLANVGLRQIEKQLPLHHACVVHEYGRMANLSSASVQPQCTHLLADLIGDDMDLGSIGHVALVHSNAFCRSVCEETAQLT